MPQLSFSEFEGAWKSIKIGKIGKPSMCKRIMKDQTLSVGDIPFYKIGTFGKEADAYISNDLYIEYKTKFSFPKKGDILISASGTIGRTVIYDGKPAFFQDSNIVWIANNEDKVLNAFLVYSYENVTWTTENTTIARLYNDNLKNISIAVPSLPEQQKIASFFTVLDDKITKLTKKKELLEQYKKGVMQKIFNQELRFKDDNGFDFSKWEVKKLGELTSLITKGTTPTSLGFSYLKEGINFVKVECINNTGFIDIESTPKISQECNTALKRSELKIDDILFSIAGTLGRTAVVKEKDLPANTNQALAIVRLKTGVNLSFINYSLNTGDTVKYILKMVSVGAQPNLNLQQVGDITINLPCIKEQTKIANLLSDIDLKIEALNTKIENSKIFKKGLLQQMFV